MSYDELQEKDLPDYLQIDIENVTKALNGEKSHENLLEYYWMLLASSINIAQINDRLISPVHAEYLRDKYLWR